VEPAWATAALDASVISGTVPIAVQLCGCVGLAVLLRRRRRPFWGRTLPAIVLASGLATGATAWIVNSLWQPFPDPLPLRIVCWIGFAYLAVALAVTAWTTRRRGTALCAIPAVVLLLLVPAVKINAFYGYFPTVGDALDISSYPQVDVSQLARESVQPPTPGRALAETWRPPRTMPGIGATATIDIPGTTSGFPARPASIYLPPAYLGDPRPALPVVVLIAGQPGSPQDWLTAGKIAAAMDAFAHDHAGLAPIVVMPDATGSRLGNPMCLDSQLGQAETYLVQLAVRAPDTYPTFLDISGQEEPTLGSHADTVRAAFSGDEDRFRAVNPRDVLATAHLPGMVGIIAVGDHDSRYGPQADRVAEAAGRAGIRVTRLSVPGAHSWVVANTGLRRALPALAARLGLLPVPKG
jgi:hypothetical protein